MAALDTTVTEQTVDHELLEADANGYKPTDTRKFQRPSCYEVIAKNEIEVIKLPSTGAKTLLQFVGASTYSLGLRFRYLAVPSLCSILVAFPLTTSQVDRPLSTSNIITCSQGIIVIF